LSFMWMNYGAFVSSLDTKFEPQEKKLPSFIEESVRLFARALTP